MSLEKPIMARQKRIPDGSGDPQGIEQAGSRVTIAGAALPRILRAASRDGFCVTSSAITGSLAGVPCDSSRLDDTVGDCRHRLRVPGFSTRLSWQQLANRRAARPASVFNMLVGLWRPRRVRNRQRTKTFRRPAVPPGR